MSNNNNFEQDENMLSEGIFTGDIDFIDDEGFIDFIDKNFEEIKIAGCTRDSCFIWVCK